MPREHVLRSREPKTAPTLPTTMDPKSVRMLGAGLGLPADVLRALRPWINVEEVGADGLGAWLISILPLLPPASGQGEAEGSDASGREDRVVELARALSDCASDRARVHFQASRYFADNQVLARRVKALEGMLKITRRARPKETADSEGAASDTAANRYLPRR
jgi:hypothetical protein